MKLMKDTTSGLILRLSFANSEEGLRTRIGSGSVHIRVTLLCSVFCGGMGMGQTLLLEKYQWSGPESIPWNLK